MTSHASCTHPATSSARAACRKAHVNGPSWEDNLAGPTGGPSQSKAAKTADANAKRTAAAKAKHPLKERSECYVCGSRAAHAERKSGQPVCLKHIDNWENITILPL